MKRGFAVLAVTAALFAQTTTHSLLHASRQSPTDLEIRGALPGEGAARFISYEDLLALPQVTFTTPMADTNFPVPARVSGVPLDQLMHALGLKADMVMAVCGDGYRSNYPSGYLAAHHPVLVLTVNGKPQAGWPKTADGGDLGPYLIANPSFIPSFKVLSHSDEAQIPFDVERLDLRSEKEVLGAILPRGNFAPGSPVMQGYRIAQQNCYRCHNMGAEGGHMASLPWPVVGAVAKSNPELFARYVRNPQAVNPHSRMTANPGYDDQTIAALQAYFATFAAGEKQ